MLARLGTIFSLKKCTTGWDLPMFKLTRLILSLFDSGYVFLK